MSDKGIIERDKKRGEKLWGNDGRRAGKMRGKQRTGE